MTHIMKSATVVPALECFQCGNEVCIEELRLVDDLITQSPFLTGLSENFGFCSGDDRRFHGNVVNCCSACYALIVLPMATWDVDDGRAEISNIARVLRGGTRPAGAAINLERLLAGLLDLDPRSPVPSEAVHEALYLSSSSYHALLEKR